MQTETSSREMHPIRAAALRMVAVALVLLVSGSIVSVASAQDATPIVNGTPAPATDACETTTPGVGAEEWIRTELYFGTSIPNGGDVSDAEWNAFLDEEITPRFPDGLTVLEGFGQFLNSQGVIAEEESIVLVIFHPGEFVDESSASIEEIRELYETEFDQESVLRVDAEPVCVSF